MKLTLALGLQYDSNKPANVYALSVGRERALPKMDSVTEVSLDVPPIVTQIGDHLRALTYNMRGIPVLLPPRAEVDLFA